MDPKPTDDATARKIADLQATLAARTQQAELLDAGKPKRDLRDVGGTSGGLGDFLVGAGMAAAGAWLLLGRMRVTTGFGMLMGHSITGPALLTLFLGIGALFFDARSKLGWLLAGGSLALVIATTMMNMRVVFASTGLATTIGIFVLLAGGLGLVARSLTAHARS